MEFTEEQIEIIKNASYFYTIEQLLAEIMGVYEVESLVIEPYLEGLIEDRTFGGIETKLPYARITRRVNIIYGSLTYYAFYNKKGRFDKTVEEYTIIWRDLLKILLSKARTAEDYWCLGDAGTSEFTPFGDKDKMTSFVISAYEKAIDLEETVERLSDMSFRFKRDYKNLELCKKAGKKILELASTFKDYFIICFNYKDGCVFCDDVYEQALEKAVELKHQATEAELKHLNRVLKEQEK